jgi:hypothetical protein
MINTSRLVGLALLLTTGLAAHAQNAPAAAPSGPTWDLAELCSFYVDFEGTTDARFADGALSPSGIQLFENDKALPPKLDKYFVPGLRGKALSTTNGKTTIWVNYPAPNNLNTRQGTMICWLCYTEVVDVTTGNLIMNCPGYMYLNSSRIVKDKAVTETTSVYFATPPGLTAANNGWIITGRAVPWKAGEWHQVALTWNLQEFHYYEDGQLLNRQAWQTGRPAPENMAIAIGLTLAGWAGTNHNTVAMDEFYLFPAALTDDMVKAEYERLKPKG